MVKKGSKAKTNNKSKTSGSKGSKASRESVFSKFSLFFHDKPRLSLVLWIELILVGALSFLVLLPREGFPPVQFPVGLTNGTYFVDNPEQVDTDITSKISNLAKDNPAIDQIDTIASGNFFTVIASYTEEFTSETGNEQLRAIIEDNNILPAEASIEYTVIDPSKFLNQYDALVTVFADNGQSATELEAASGEIADLFAQDEGVSETELISLFDTATNPRTGEEETRQSSFSIVGLPNDSGELEFASSIVIGVNRADGTDIIELSGVINRITDEINADEAYQDLGVSIGADFAESINTQINGLLENLGQALLAVFVISFLLITWRASVITALFMVSVIFTSLFVLFLVGYAINTITLFALVLALGLFVDDATIIVEAIDAGKRSSKDARETIKKAISKVASASFAGTMTTVLVFAPLAFVSGILGEFIRILPITVVIALVTSLILSLSLIPFLARFVLFRDFAARKKSKPTVINRAEARMAAGLASFIGLATRGRKTAIGLSTVMILVSIFFFMASGSIASQLKFNIFPPSKDSDQLLVDISYPPSLTIDEAQARALEVGEIARETLGENAVKMNFGAFQPATERSSDILIELIPFTDRDVKSPELIANLEAAFKEFDGGITRISQADAGPPSEQFPFTVQIYTEDRDKALKLATAIEQDLKGAQVERQNGTTANITDTRIDYTVDVARRDGAKYVQVEAAFDDNDVTALTLAAQEYVEAIYDEAALSPFDIPLEDVRYDFGFESDSQDSFSSLLIVGPLAVLAMFILLAIQFRSLLQPLLIFLAIPFSFFGVMFGLNVTNNPISFFVMIGFFGLIGISVNNTILMTDYANQERREGKRIIDAIAAAAQKRFRPLLTTSLTTVAALLPLALTDPFWEALAFTIIFGLLSSTFFVVISFPFYYMLVEGGKARIIGRWRKLRGRA